MITSKSQFIKNEIYRKIVSGELRAESRLLPERELMRQYKVSYATMSRALNDLKAAGVIDRKWGKGTFVLGIKKMVKNIAVTFGSNVAPSHPWMVPIIRGIGEEVGQFGYHMQLFPLSENAIFGLREQSLLNKLISNGDINGVIALSPHSPEDIQKLTSLELPVVTVGNEYPYSGVPSVLPDIEGGIRQVFDYLVSGLGHKRLGIILGPKREHSARLSRMTTRLGDALLHLLGEYKLQHYARTVHVEQQWEAVSGIAHDWLLSSERPTAIFVSDDILAVEILKLAGELGLKVPQDLNIVGWGDILHHSQLTSVHVPLVAMGKSSVNIINEVVSGLKPQSVYVPTRLIVRESSGKLVHK